MAICIRFIIFSGIEGKVDILYAIDGSQTVDTWTFRKVKSFLEKAISLQKISPELANVGLVVFGGDKPMVPLHLSRGNSELAVQKGIKKAVKVGGRRLLKAALIAIGKEFKIHSIRNGVGKMAILLTTGEDESLAKPEYKTILNDLKAEGVKIFMMNIGKPLLNSTLDEIGESFVGGVRDMNLSKDPQNALGVVEKAIANESCKLHSMSLTRFIIVACNWIFYSKRNIAHSSDIVYKTLCTS